MTLATLIENTNTDPAFAFEHRMAHSRNFGIMSPLSRFSVLPYLLDPVVDGPDPSSNWNLDHQQAHNDAIASFPPQPFILYGRGTTVEPQPPDGLPFNFILVDTDLNDQGQLPWWELQNLVEHQIMSSIAQPQVFGGTTAHPLTYGRTWVFPFA